MISRQVKTFSEQDVALHLVGEMPQARRGLYAEGTVREIHSLASGERAVLVVEADAEAEARQIVGSPVAQRGMCYGLRYSKRGPTAVSFATSNRVRGSAGLTSS